MAAFFIFHVRRTLVHHITFTLQLTPAALRFRGFAHTALGGFLVMTTHFHFTKYALALHFLLQRTECLLDIVIPYIYFYHANYLLPVQRDAV